MLASASATTSVACCARRRPHSDKPEVVNQIMSLNFALATNGDAAWRVIAMLSARHPVIVPVVDASIWPACSPRPICWLPFTTAKSAAAARKST